MRIAGLPAAMRPPFSFWSCQKENGPRPVQGKKTLARNLRLKRKFAYVREISESVLTKPWQTSSGSRRTWAFAPLCLRVCQSGGNFGAVIERSVLLYSLALCLVVNGGLARRADEGVGPCGCQRNLYPGGTAQGLPPQQAPEERQRKEKQGVSGPSPGQRFPQGHRV